MRPGFFTKEPFEANFVLDVAERGLRDMLAVTKEFSDPAISIPDYQVLPRRVSQGVMKERRISVFPRLLLTWTLRWKE